jgi:serine/threonine protein kinase
MSACEETQGPRAHVSADTIRQSEAGPQRLHDPVDGQAVAPDNAKGVASFREFAAALTEIGLIDAAELEPFAVDSAEGVLGLSRALVKAGKLTPYQAAAIYQKKSRGLLIGNYLVLDMVGRGGMGMVFKARHRKLRRLGALKILPPSFTRDSGAVMRFRREFEAAGRLTHPNLVAAFEADEDRGVHFLVMDYVEGINLERVIREQGRLPVTCALDYLIQSARGLEAAHEKGIVHRDIKPGNLMLDRRGTIRVLDLGLARIVDASNPFGKTITGRLTQSNTYMGTIDYMAPEQAEDSHSVDHRADIYSLACTFFFLLTGREPFPGKTILKRMVAHQEYPAPSLRAIRPDVSRALEAVYQKMMAKKPEDRPASMTEVIALLQASKHSTDSNTAAVAPPPAPTSAAEICKQAPLEQGRPPRPTVDSAIFARRIESEEMAIDSKLNLWDLLMDVPSDIGVAGEQGADQDECAVASDDHELNLGELAMALREETAASAARKPSVAYAPSPEPAAPPRTDGKQSEPPIPLASERHPIEPAASIRQEEKPPARPKSPPADAPSPKAAAPQRKEEKPSEPPKPPAADAQPLKRSGPPQRAEMPSTSPKPLSATAQPLRSSAPPQHKKAQPDRPQSPADESEPLKPAELARSGGLTHSKAVVILALVTAVLLILAVVVSFSGRPESGKTKDARAPAPRSTERGNSPVEALPPPM